MIPSVFNPLLVAVFALLASEAISAQPLHWWKVDSVRKELGLTTEQSTHIESIFKDSIAQLLQQKDELDRLEGKLSHLIEASADEGQVTRQIDRVETMRAALNKTRTLMLLHMRQVLSPEQRVKLNAMHDRWDREQRGKDKPRPSPDGSKRRYEPRKPSE